MAIESQSGSEVGWSVSKVVQSCGIVGCSVQVRFSKVKTINKKPN